MAGGKPSCVCPSVLLKVASERLCSSPRPKARGLWKSSYGLHPLLLFFWSLPKADCAPACAQHVDRDRRCGQKSPGLGMESGDLDLNPSLNLTEGVSLARACPPGCGVRALAGPLSRCPLLLSTPGNWPPGIAVTLICVGEQRKGCILGCQVMSVVLFLADKMMPEGVFLQYLALL